MKAGHQIELARTTCCFQIVGLTFDTISGRDFIGTNQKKSMGSYQQRVDGVNVSKTRLCLRLMKSLSICKWKCLSCVYLLFLDSPASMRCSQ